MRTAFIRYCTGGCSHGPHHAHYYTVDPVDGPMGGEQLCPGNLGEAREFLEDGEPGGFGFIATEESNTEPKPQNTNEH